MKIQIKRGAASGLDSLSLSEGELAAVLDTGDLYVGTDDSGGKKQVNRRKCLHVRSNYTYVPDMNEGLGMTKDINTIALSGTPAVGDWVIMKDSKNRLCLLEVTKPNIALTTCTLVWQMDLSAEGISNLFGYTPANADDVTPKMSKKQILDMFYPVGTIYQTDDKNFKPADAWGGLWVEVTGCFLYGTANANDVKKFGGSRSHTLTLGQMPKHSHPIYINNEGGETITPSTGDYLVSDSAVTRSKKSMYATLATDYEGNAESFSIMPPYYNVKIWRRTG